MGRVREEPAICDPESELRLLGEREKKKGEYNKILGVGRKKQKKKYVGQTTAVVRVTSINGRARR